MLYELVTLQFVPIDYLLSALSLCVEFDWLPRHRSYFDYFLPCILNLLTWIYFLKFIKLNLAMWEEIVFIFIIWECCSGQSSHHQFHRWFSIECMVQETSMSQWATFIKSIFIYLPVIHFSAEYHIPKYLKLLYILCPINRQIKEF